MKLGILMDDINNINPKKDSTLSMLIAAQELGWELYIFDSPDMSFTQNQIYAKTKKIKVFDDLINYYKLIEEKIINLKVMDIILMRKDPPFNMNYIYATYLLQELNNKGTKVVNNPQSLRDFNEKLSIMQFPDLIINTLVSSSYKEIKNFVVDFEHFILKPLDEMGGSNIFKHAKGDDIKTNINVLTKNQTTPIMVQKFIPEIKNGDKRIILIKGKPIEYSLARIPKKGSFKGNLAQGASFEVRELSPRDIYICQEIKDFLISNQLDFVGIDVIGDYLSEINITSPTGIQEIDNAKNTNIAKDFLLAISE